MSSSEEFGFKICVIGDGAVGKTSLIKKYTEGTFEKDYIKTIGAQFSKFSKMVDEDIINLIFWDIAGQDDFGFLQPLFYKESRACIIVFSLEENDLGKDSFNHITEWYHELIKYCGNIPVVIFANKVDLIEENELDNITIEKVVKDHNFLGYYLTSAKTGKGVVDAFDSIINELYSRYKPLFSP
ncbi:MAG: Rab family GTPase [Candidatus Thorarchaeota archaeon]